MSLRYQWYSGLNVLFAFISAFAFAELVDNAMAATAENDGSREIEIRLVWLLASSMIIKNVLKLSQVPPCCTTV